MLCAAEMVDIYEEAARIHTPPPDQAVLKKHCQIFQIAVRELLLLSNKLGIAKDDERVSR